MGDENDNKLDAIGNAFKSVVDNGLKIQELGNRLVSVGNTGMEVVEYLKTAGSKIEEMGTKMNCNGAIEPINRWINYSYGAIFYLSDTGNQLKNNANTFLFNVSSNVSGGMSAIASATVSIRSMQQANQDISVQNSIPIFQYSKYKEDISILSLKLNEIEPSLEEMRKGAWEALNSPGSDKLKQASNSIRNVLNWFICKWASNEDVKSAKWWTANDDGKDGVILEQRYMYLLFGKDEPKDEAESQYMFSQAASIKSLDRLLKEVLHGHNTTKELVEQTIKAVETFLLRISSFKRP